MVRDFPLNLFYSGEGEGGGEVGGDGEDGVELAELEDLEDGGAGIEEDHFRAFAGEGAGGGEEDAQAEGGEVGGLGEVDDGGFAAGGDGGGEFHLNLLHAGEVELADEGDVGDLVVGAEGGEFHKCEIRAKLGAKMSQSNSEICDKFVSQEGAEEVGEAFHEAAVGAGAGVAGVEVGDAIAAEGVGPVGELAEGRGGIEEDADFEIHKEAAEVHVGGAHEGDLAVDEDEFGVHHLGAVEEDFDAGVVQLTQVIVAGEVGEGVVGIFGEDEADAAAEVGLDDEGAEENFVGDEVGRDDGEVAAALLDEDEKAFPERVARGVGAAGDDFDGFVAARGGGVGEEVAEIAGGVAGGEAPVAD